MTFIVDDDTLKRWSLFRILERAVYQVREASLSGGADARETLRPGLILLDIMVPHGNGFALPRSIQASILDVASIEATAHASQDTAQAAESLGARGHLAKPCESTKLLALVAGALGAGLSS